MGHDDTGDVSPTEQRIPAAVGAPADCNIETDAWYTSAEEDTDLPID
ncbi:MAG: hypothetical protein IIC70_09880 [Acidobacteria bacterium]|nr:hypothetical protein [Acidobacteriota bacterium]MCH8990428.1 hypothetical protein [Acidobacteriota bacterium]